MFFGRTIPGGDDLLAHPAGGDATLGGRLRAVTERRDVVVDRAQVSVAVIVASTDVVDTVRAAATTHVTDPAVVTEDPLTLSVPGGGKPYPTIRVRPLSGSH